MDISHPPKTHEFGPERSEVCVTGVLQDSRRTVAGQSQDSRRTTTRHPSNILRTTHPPTNKSLLKSKVFAQSPQDSGRVEPKGVSCCVFSLVLLVYAWSVGVEVEKGGELVVIGGKG
jgi:hypothetical protein